MAKKLKCWKAHKVSKRGTTYTKSIGDFNPKIEHVYIYQGYADDFVTNIQGRYKGHSNRKEALKFAKAYMKKHDKC